MSTRPDIPGFDVMELIGTGGFSNVYRAVQTEFGREVAVKVLRIDAHDDRLRHAFERECALAGRLTGHPNVLTVLASGFVPDSEEPYLVLEYCPGGTLSKRLSSGGPLTVHDALSLGISLAGALHSAHCHGIIHRDVKPQNVLYTRAGVPALTDFGVAKLRGPDAVSVTGSGLTPLHAAPEVLRQGPASPASDLYSLGSTLYTALSGHPPFGSSADAPYLVMQRSITEPVPELKRRDVPDDLEDLLVAVMAKEPADRPTVPEFAAELRRCAHRRSSTVPDFVVLEPPSNFDPDVTTDSVGGAELAPSPAVISLQRTRRRRRTSRSMIAVAAASALVAAAAVTWGLTRQENHTAAPTAAASPTSSTTIGPTSTTTAGPDDARIVLPEGPQRDPPVEYPPPAVPNNFRDRVDNLDALALLLELPQRPPLIDRPVKFDWLEAVPFVGTWVTTNGQVAPRCSQMITDPILVQAYGEVIAFDGEPLRAVDITLTKFASIPDATQFFNGASVYAGISERECAEATQRRPGLVEALGPRVEHENEFLPVPRSRELGLSAVNTWIGVRGLEGASGEASPIKTGYVAIALLNSTVIQLRAGPTTFVTPQLFDQILTVATKLAGA